MSRLRFLHLIDSHQKKIRVDSLFTFGRLTEGFKSISQRVSRAHFEIEPLSVDDHRCNSGAFCAQLTLKGYYLRITSDSNSISKEYTKKGERILIQHQDKLDLVHSQNISEQYTLTVYDSLHDEPNRKRKRDHEAEYTSTNLNDSLYGSPTKKRPRLQDDSMCYDYKNMVSLSPSDHNHNIKTNHNNASPHSLSGLMMISPSRSNSKSSNNSNPSPKSSGSKYSNLLASFPMNNKDDIKRKLSTDELNSDDDDYLDKLLEDLEPKEEKEHILNISKEEEKLKQEQEIERLFNDGRYSLALPIIDCDRDKFDVDRTLNVIANALKQFMCIYRHPKLRIVVIATKKYKDLLDKELKKKYDMNITSSLDKSMSLDLEFEDKYDIFECDERIILYHGEWSDIVELKSNGICCQYITNFTFWNFSGKKGGRLNKLINSKCNDLSGLCINKYQTAKKKYHCYSVPINDKNGGYLYLMQNIRCILQIRPPSMNCNSHDFVFDKERAWSDLYDTYYRIMQTFYKLTQLTAPANDTFIAKDVANWNNKAFIKKENMSLTQKQSNNNNNMSLDDNNNDDLQHSALMEMDLHFSLKSVPEYSVPTVHQWPKYNGNWKNALSVYIEDKSKRDDKWNKCIFYEDDKFVIIYDRYFKAKIHLLIIPKMKIQSVYDLDPLNDDDIEMMEGMIARAQWIKSGILKRNKIINNILYGFHAIPSMNQIHCHLISNDMDSINLKNKKHFHSFTSNYFIPAKVMLNLLRDDKKKFKINKDYYQSLLKQNLKCHFCFNNKIKTIPALKKHIKQCQFAKNTKDSDDDEFRDFEIVFEGDDHL